MNRALRPERFNTETNDPHAEQLYKHWKKTLSSYLETALATPTTTGEPSAAPDAATIAATAAQQKLYTLINHISAHVFQLIGDATTFDDAVNLLDGIYIKPANIIYNRHKLMTTKQEPPQSVDTYVQELKRIAKTCQFQAATADQYRQQYIRDAFINGLSSLNIRQRLLENDDLTLDQAKQKARALEQAQKQAESYNVGDVHTVATIAGNEKESTILAGIKRATISDTREMCFFCGNLRHARSNCPARNSECRKCMKKGHWAKVCKSQVSAAVGNEGTRSSPYLP